MNERQARNFEREIVLPGRELLNLHREGEIIEGNRERFGNETVKESCASRLTIDRESGFEPEFTECVEPGNMVDMEMT